ncbi:hypothetical protein AURDEDRAFT_170993 [Auricularia subglabra TFB-10046 SS5]|nr:hypothetical protein AURDEDRAFT_170993 [Auricularia subglabra TFB-10046 SS5]
MCQCAQSQSVVFRGITGSGKTFASRLVTNQLLRVSSHSDKDASVSGQVKAIKMCSIQSYFNDHSRIAGTQALTWGLDRSCLMRLHHEERTFHTFYQFPAGATPDERNQSNPEDPSEYVLLPWRDC